MFRRTMHPAGKARRGANYRARSAKLCTGNDVVQQVSGSVCADASIADKPAARKDARTDGAGVDGQAPEPSAHPDAKQPVDQGATPDLPASEAAK
jgi:hypothetical protein